MAKRALLQVEPKTRRPDTKCSAHCRLIFALGLSIFSVSRAHALEPAPIETALTRIESGVLKHWSYTVETQRGDERRIERHDMTAPNAQRWTLVSTNGHTPTKDELDEYREERQKRGKKSGQQQFSLVDAIDRKSLRETSSNQTHTRFNFRLDKSQEHAEKFADQVRGTLRMDHRIPFIERIEMKNTGTVNPIFGVKIESFSLRMDFAWNEELGVSLPQDVYSTVRGRAFLVKELDETIHIQFREYKPHPHATEQNP